MKRKLFLIWLLALLTFFSGCTTDTESRTAAISQKLCTSPVTLEQVWFDEDLSWASKHYLDKSPRIDYLESAEQYATGSGVDSDFAQAYPLAAQVTTLPVYGSLLQPTDMAIYLFYDGATIFGIGCLGFDETGRAITSSYRDVQEASTFVTALSLEDCYMSIQSCMDYYPDFTITGMVYSTEGYPMCYPIGTSEGSTVLQYALGGLKDFRYAFSSPEEGRQLLTAYNTERRSILSQITIYPWNDAIPANGQFVGRSDFPQDLIPVEYDFVAAAPLLTNTLEEGIFSLHLLYKDNQLVAEYVIQRTQQDGISSYAIVWEQLSGSGSLSGSEYARILTGAYEAQDGWSPQGVIFDGAFKPIGVSGQQVLVYDAETGSLLTY